MSRRRFSPWREDFYASAAFVVVAAAAVGMAILAKGWLPILLNLALAVACLHGAQWSWRNGIRRWYGKDLERWAVERLTVRLARIGAECRASVPVPRLGDVDALVNTTTGPVVVEVKSFQRWRQGWGGQGPREAAATAQVQRLAAATGAVASYIWLPRGKPTFFQRFGRLYADDDDRIEVIIGGERKMLRAIGKHHRMVDSVIAVMRSRKGRKRD